MKPEEIQTTKPDYKKGFLEIAQSKSIKMKPYVAEARSLEALLDTVSQPEDLVADDKFAPSLITAYGISSKALNNIRPTDSDRREMVKEFVENFLIDDLNFKSEVTIRHTVIRGDSFGGEMRNYIGALAKAKLARAIIAGLRILGKDFYVRIKDSKSFITLSEMQSEENIDAIYWVSEDGDNRVLLFDKKSPLAKTNIDIILLRSSPSSIKDSLGDAKSYLACGELKGGIDPAGSDEHWKTANEALRRVRSIDQTIKTFFVGAAIERRVAEEISKQISNSTLNKAANLNHDKQLAELANWLVEL